jgi:hypothetical protein
VDDGVQLKVVEEGSDTAAVASGSAGMNADNASTKGGS